MPKLRTLSGQDLLRIFALFGFQRIGQKGSHIKLNRTLGDGTRQRLTVPLHKEVDRGTLQAIYRQALRHLSDAELRPHFYSE